jgi:aryl-alcohol dehydrogenase-like predicted oxidoreductase
MVHIAARLGVPPPVVCQPYYNLLNRMPEVEILPACHHHGIGVASYSPIARGVLTGKYAPGAAPDPTTRAGRADKRMVETEFRQESLVIAQTLGAHAQSRGVTLAQFATAWVLANGMLSSFIAGPRTLAQWQDYFPAVEFRLVAGDEALVDSLVPQGHPSTPGFTDPAYPLTGRITSAHP